MAIVEQSAEISQARWARERAMQCQCGHAAAKHPCLPRTMTGRPDLYGGCLADGCPCVWFEEAK